MTKLPIEKGVDNKILRTKSAPIERIDKSIKKLIKDMMETMEKKNGLGLASPQVGVNKRLVIVTLNYDTDHEMVIPLINPQILTFSDEKNIAEEGCLSLPGIYKLVKRSSHVRLKYKDQKGNEHILELDDMNARVVQHEIDHLDGVLFVDRVKEQAKEADYATGV